MSLLPENDRILLGPGPSLTAPRVMRAMAAPTVSHLDPLMMTLLDDVRARLGRVFRAAEGSFAFAVSGTGTSGMEAAVANLVKDGSRVHVELADGPHPDRVALGRHLAAERLFRRHRARGLRSGRHRSRRSTTSSVGTLSAPAERGRGDPPSTSAARPFRANDLDLSIRAHGLAGAPRRKDLRPNAPGRRRVSR